MKQRAQRSAHGTSSGVPKALLLAICLYGASVAVEAQLTTEVTVLKEGPAPPFGPSISLGEFGATQLAADFDGDGFDDLAVGRPGGGDGRVYVFTGGAGGPSYTQTLSQFSTIDLGASFAACDFDDDGNQDLVVGAPSTAIDSLFAAGAVFIYLGGPTGLTAVQSLTREDLGLSVAGGERFGESLAAADFDGDEKCDLAISSPRANQTGAVLLPQDDVGEVSIVWGLGNGLLDTGGALTFQEADVPSTKAADTKAFDNFGETLATAAATSGSMLLVGVPKKDVGTNGSVGRVWIVRLAGRSLDSSTRLDYADFGVLGDVQALARFGRSLAAGRFVGGGLALQIAIGIPGYAVSTGETAGAVLIVAFVGPHDDSFFASQRLDQELPVFGSTPQDGEFFGESVSVADIDGDLWDDLVIGVVRDDLSTTRGVSSAVPFGSVHVVYGGVDGFASIETFDEADAGGVPENDSFGQSFGAGDFFGRGAASLAVGAPNKNAVATLRGSSPEDDHGIVYVFEAREATAAAEQVVRTGAPLPGAGGDTIVTLSDAAMSDLGAPGFRGVWTSGESFVSVGGAVVFQDSDVACATGESVERGFALTSNVTFGHLDRTGNGCADPAGDFDAVITSGGLLADETDPAPGGGSVGKPEQLVSTAEGRLYFLGKDGADERILRTAAGFVHPLETVKATGQPEDGLTVKSIDRFVVSPGGIHLLYSGVLGSIADNNFIVLDGSRVVNGFGAYLGDPSILDFGALAVADDGRFLFAPELDDGTHRVYLADSTGALAGVGGEPSFGGVSLEGLQPFSLSWGAEGRAVHLWGELVPDGSPFVQVARGRVLFGVCRAELEKSIPLLQVGQTVRTSPSEPPATVTEIYPVNGREGLEIGAEGALFVRVGLERGADTFDAIIGVIQDCGIFTDGFESGDASAWR